MNNKPKPAKPQKNEPKHTDFTLMPNRIIKRLNLKHGTPEQGGQGGLTMLEYRLYSVMRMRVNRETGVAFVGYGDLAKEIGLTESERQKVKRMINYLAQLVEIMTDIAYDMNGNTIGTLVKFTDEISEPLPDDLLHPFDTPKNKENQGFESGACYTPTTPYQNSIYNKDSFPPDISNNPGVPVDKYAVNREINLILSTLYWGEIISEEQVKSYRTRANDGDPVIILEELRELKEMREGSPAGDV